MTGFINTTGKDDWATPPGAINYAKRVLGVESFDLDAAALGPTRQAGAYLGPDHADPTRRDALAVSWAGLCDRPDPVIWLNPPYSRAGGGLRRWLGKAVEASRAGATVAALFFARTDTAAWHDCVAIASSVHLFRGRLSFLDPATGERRHPAPAPSCLVIWRPRCRPPPRFIHASLPRGAAIIDPRQGVLFG